MMDSNFGSHVVGGLFVLGFGILAVGIAAGAGIVGLVWWIF